jgi:hypothetical protein
MEQHRPEPTRADDDDRGQSRALPGADQPPAALSRPLCVDLDGTLIRTDLAVEHLLQLLKRNPLYLFLLPLWLWQGARRFETRDRQTRAVRPG